MSYEKKYLKYKKKYLLLKNGKFDYFVRYEASGGFSDIPSNDYKKYIYIGEFTPYLIDKKNNLYEFEGFLLDESYNKIGEKINIKGSWEKKNNNGEEYFTFTDNNGKVINYFKRKIKFITNIYRK